ncbi:MAG: S41 family peptidase, partial [Planctomycetales bacterium]
TLIYRSGNRLRAIKAGEKPDEGKPGEAPSRKNGWLDSRRFRVSIEPPAERRQMYREAWRLQRDHYWTEDMAEVDWEQVHDRYLPLLERVGTRSEFSDLLWEMQGELGTSHAYEMGGDYRNEPRYDQGFLGADFEYDANSEGYRLVHLVRGDSWDVFRDSSLNRLGLNLEPGDVLKAVGGRPVSQAAPPAALLVHQAGCEVELTFDCKDGRKNVLVRALRDERSARYREWVETNRRAIHDRTEGRVGYVHLPDMAPRGYAEFHRSFLAESDRDALIIDARYNGGGHVSPLILEKLARRRIGWCVPRWGEPRPYPDESAAGPLVALTNEVAGSDGDIFSHCFKMMGLGPLVGTRTWGGVIGTTVDHWLVDGTATTQPEFFFWFQDVRWGLENRGAEPDVTVEITPADEAAGRDPQLDKAVELCLDGLKKSSPSLPDLGDRPSRRLPRFPS